MSKKKHKEEEVPTFNRRASDDYEASYRKFWDRNNERQQAIFECLSILDRCADAEDPIKSAALVLIKYILTETEDRLM